MKLVLAEMLSVAMSLSKVIGANQRGNGMPQAEKQVKIRLALEAVAAAENIEASEEEVSAEIKRIADLPVHSQFQRTNNRFSLNISVPLL